MNSKAFILIIILTCCLFFLAGSQPILNKRHALAMLASDKPDSILQNACNYLGNVYLREAYTGKAQLDSAFFYIRKSIYLTDSLNAKNEPGTNEALCLLAEAYIKNDQLSNGKKIFQQAIRNYERGRDRKKEAETWHRYAQSVIDKEPDIDTIQCFYMQAAYLYQQLRDTANMVRVRLDLAFFHFRMGNASLAEQELFEVITLSKSYGSYMLPIAYYYLSVVKRYAGRYEEGLQFAIKAEKSLHDISDTSSAHNVYGELALEYQELNRPEEAVFWYKKCLQARSRMNAAQYFIYRTMYLMVVQMLKTGKGKEALEQTLALEQANPATGAINKGVLAQTKAYCYASLGMYTDAEKYFLEMDRYYAKEPPVAEVLFISSYDIGHFYIDRHEYQKAAPFLARAFELKFTTTISRVRDLHLMMFRLDSAAGNYVRAIDHYQAYKELNDSLFSEAKSKAIEELIIKYEVEKKDQDLVLYEKENKIQQGRLGQAWQTRKWMIAGGVLMLIIMGLLFHNARIKQKANGRLKLQQREISRQNTSLQQLVMEKEWLMKEIHHRVKNNFHIVQGLLGTQSGYLKNDEALNALADSRHRVQAMSLIHQRLYQSDDLSGINMSEYTHELMSYLRESFNVRSSIQFQLRIEPVQLDISHSIPLGLIMNEAITNAIKYAFPDGRPGIIEVMLQRHGRDTFVLGIKDNGVGLPPGVDIRQYSSMGMVLIQGLSDDIDGKLTVSGAGGTLVRIEFKYERFHDSGNEDHPVQINFHS